MTTKVDVRRFPLAALFRLEVLMLIRRRSSLVVVGLIALMLLLTLTKSAGTGTAAIANRAIGLMFFVPIGVGILLSDRLVRDRQQGLSDLLASTPVPLWRRGLMVALGSLTGPCLIVTGTLMVISLVHAALERDPALLLSGLLVSVTVIVPGLLVVTTLSWLLGLLLPLPAARVIVVGFWLWACMLNPHVIPVPSTTGTVLSPLGEYAAIAIGARPIYKGLGVATLSPPVSTNTAVLSVASLIVISMVLLACALALANRRGARR